MKEGEQRIDTELDALWRLLSELYDSRDSALAPVGGKKQRNREKQGSRWEPPIEPDTDNAP